jgi:3-hydroxy-9,10-secoandrosta-1,3,5(10)-triene-9,17-dione monooxygenase reductase component
MHVIRSAVRAGGTTHLVRRARETSMSQLPTAHPDDLRRAMRAFASGVCVVTSRGPGGEPVGMTVSAFFSVSLAPPLVAVSLYRDTLTTRTIAEVGLFAVNILADSQESISRRFAARDIDRFEGVAWHRGENGVPLLDGTVAQLECTVETEFAGGDHRLVLGRVAVARRYGGRPLLYHDAGYRRLFDETS